MIPKDYVTHAKPQLTSLMIQKCYVTHAGRQLIFKKLKFVLTRNLKFEYNVHCLTFWVLLSAKFTDDSRAVPIRQTKIRTNKLRWYQPTLSFYWFFQQPLVSSCLIWGVSYSPPPKYDFRCGCLVLFIFSLIHMEESNIWSVCSRDILFCIMYVSISGFATTLMNRQLLVLVSTFRLMFTDLRCSRHLIW